MKFFILFFAVVAAASAGYIGYDHAPTVHHAHYIPQHAPIPPPHPEPLHLKVHDHPTKIHYHAPHVPHPHLVGVEHYEHGHEPSISVVKTGHGHGWD